MLRLYLYARVRVFKCAIAHETAGAARTRSSLRPLFSRVTLASLGRKSRRENAIPYSLVVTRVGGRSSIPEAAVIEPISRGVLDAPPSRGMTVQWRVGISSSLLTKRSLVARMSAATSGATLTLHIPPSSPAKAGDPVSQRQQ